METVLITGGTGLIGKALTAMLVKEGYQVIIFTRDSSAGKQRPEANVTYVKWFPERDIIDPPAIQQADYIVHLAGAGVADKRWTSARKKEISESRTKSGALLVKALQENANKVKAVISSSAIGWYGADPVIPNPKPFSESDPPDTGFLGVTCRLWEESIHPVALLNKRLVFLRTGIVLSNNGGALNEFKKPLRFKVATILGSGRQVISWIHITDLCRMYLEAIKNELISGCYNAVTPNPVSNKELTLWLARSMKMEWFLPVHVPSFILKFAIGEMSEEVLKSATVSGAKIGKTGFHFLYPTIESALNHIIKTPSV